MTDRKFTPPTEFPAEYVDQDGNRSVVLGRSNNKNYPLIGFDHTGYARSWSEKGRVSRNISCTADLHDKPKRITTWHNVYPNQLSTAMYSRADADAARLSCGRLCVYRIERDEDGRNPEIFVEEEE